MQPGDLVAGRFELERVVGEGGMGTVFRARDRASDGHVALKTLRDAGDPADVRRFAQEAAVLAELSHPAIVRYVAHGAIEGGAGAYLAMEWLEGEDLAHRLARGPLAEREAAVLAARVADALAAVHARGVVHRDIKPGNLFLVGGAVEQVRVLDFGVARIRRGGAAPATRTGALVGTPAYMAPEQARGARDLAPSVDVFALGCVLYECLTGAPAFAGDHVVAVLAKILLEEAPRARGRAPSVSPALDALVAAMLAKDPARRPPDGRAVALALARLDDARDRSGGDDDDARPAVEGDVDASAVPAALTRGELRLLSLVVVGSADPRDVAAAPTLVSGMADPVAAALRAIAARCRARLELLLGGAAVFTLEGRGSATDQAAEAARCALSVRDAVGPDVPVALATGRGLRADGGTFGEAVDRAAALLAQAPAAGAAAARARDANAVRVDELTVGLLDARFDVGGDASGLVLRGFRALDAPAARTLLGRATPCVGRARELALLAELYAGAARESAARAVLVTAPPGVGKSRLCRELLADLARPAESAAAPPQVWSCAGDPMSAGSAYAMLGVAVRRAAGVVDGEPAALSQQKLRARVARHVAPRDAARVAELIGEVAGVAFPDVDPRDPRARRDPVLLADQVREAWESWLAAECAAGPVLLVLEDLHWGDAPSVKLVDGALKRLAARPLVVLALARPEVADVFPRLWSRRGVLEVRLEQLSARASEELVRFALGAEARDDTVARVVERAGGNGLFLEELIRSVAAGRGDAFPETVLAMAQVRIAGLDDDARRVLRAASVFGPTFWRGGVAELLGGGERVNTRLAELVDDELIEPEGAARFPGEQQYAFRHALLRDAAYAMLTDADRAAGHRLAAGWLERQGEADARVLAEHLERAGERARAVDWYQRAARQAYHAHDPQATAARIERAVACGAAGEQLAHLRALESAVHWWLGHVDRAERAGREVFGLVAPGTSLWYRAVASVFAPMVHRPHTRDWEPIAEAVAALEPTPGTARDYVLAASVVATELCHLGRCDDARALLARLERAVEAGEIPRADARLAARVLQLRAWCALLEPDPWGALGVSTAASAAFEASGDIKMQTWAGWVQLAALYQLGAWDAALAQARAWLEVARRARVELFVGGTRYLVGMVLANVGDEAGARAALAEALQMTQAVDNTAMQGVVQSGIAHERLRVGDVASAEAAARRAVALLEPYGTHLPGACASLAAALRAQGRASEALAAAVQGEAARRAAGGVFDAEVALPLELALARDALGDREGARAALAEARARLDCVAAKITDATYRERFLRAVPANARVAELERDWG